MRVLVGTDFFTAEVLTLKGLVTALEVRFVRAAAGPTSFLTERGRIVRTMIRAILEITEGVRL